MNVSLQCHIESLQGCEALQERIQRAGGTMEIENAWTWKCWQEWRLENDTNARLGIKRCSKSHLSESKIVNGLEMIIVQPLGRNRLRVGDFRR